MSRSASEEGRSSPSSGWRRSGTFADIFAASSSSSFAAGRDDATAALLPAESSGASNDSNGGSSHVQSPSPPPPRQPRQSRIRVAPGEEGGGGDMRHSASAAAIIDIGRIEDWRDQEKTHDVVALGGRERGRREEGGGSRALVNAIVVSTSVLSAGGEADLKQCPRKFHIILIGMNEWHWEQQ